MAEPLPQPDADSSNVERAISILRPFRVEEVAAVLDGLVDRGSDRRLRKAARVLTPGRRGPRPHNDEASLDQMEWLQKNHKARSIEHAATLVGNQLIGETSPASARERLARKYRLRIFQQISGIKTEEDPIDVD